MRNESWLDIRIFKTPEVEQPENQTAFKLTPKSGKSKRISAFQDYGDGGRNDTLVTNAI